VKQELYYEEEEYEQKKPIWIVLYAGITPFLRLNSLVDLYTMMKNNTVNVVSSASMFSKVVFW